MSLQIQMGYLNFSDKTECFETTLTINDVSSDLTICDIEKSDSAKAKAIATKIMMWLENNLDKAKEFAASRLLKLKNESWLSENEKPISSERFIELLELDGINAFSEGSFEIYFNDSDLFWGHTIIIDVDENFKFENANIAG